MWAIAASVAFQNATLIVDILEVAYWKLVNPCITRFYLSTSGIYSVGMQMGLMASPSWWLHKQWSPTTRPPPPPQELFLTFWVCKMCCGRKLPVTEYLACAYMRIPSVTENSLGQTLSQWVQNLQFC